MCPVCDASAALKGVLLQVALPFQAESEADHPRILAMLPQVLQPLF